MTVYTGMWRDDMTHYLDRWPQMKTCSENLLFKMAMRDKALFDGLWVNCVMILQAFDPHEVVVIVRGREVRMSDDPSLMAKYEVMDTGEVYIDTDWEAYK